MRVPLANAILDITGKRALADAGGPEGDRVLYEAHEAAATLYTMGLKSETDLLALEPAWGEDWRGVQGGTIKQFLAFASEHIGGKHDRAKGRSNGRRPEPESNAAKMARVFAMMEQDEVPNGDSA